MYTVHCIHLLYNSVMIAGFPCSGIKVEPRTATADFWKARPSKCSGGHILGTPPLPSPCSVSQNPGKTLVLAVLPPVAALGTICKNCKPEIQWFTVPCTNICHTQYNAELQMVQ